MEREWSREAEDGEWDAFLESCPDGEYQQSSIWAQAKGGEGWSVERVLARGGENQIVGGFQVLWRATRIGRIGYVSRGPVVAPSHGGEQGRLVSGLKEAVQRLSLQALIVQGPEGNQDIEKELSDRGFLPNRIRRIVTATWVIPVAHEPAVLDDAMRASTRAKVRRGLRRGVVIRVGGKRDIAAFHKLMCMSCERQGVAPNPASALFLEKLWTNFPHGLRTHLAFAEYEGRPVSAVFCLCFGRKVWIWKKGNDPGFLHVHPGELLYRETLAWASRHGYEAVDHEAIARHRAEALLAGEPGGPELVSSRDFFVMGFGGHPELLPEAMVWIRNPILRQIYRWTACSRIGSRLLRRFYEC